VHDAQPELKAEDLGARVRAVRELQGAAQADVARAAGMSRRELQAAERGGKRLTTAELQALARALGVELDVLIGVSTDRDLLPATRPSPERRKDLATRSRIEQSWSEVRADLDELLTTCARLVSAGSGDDVRRLLERLERDLQGLKVHHSFLRKLADHERDLQRARRPQGDPLPSELRVPAGP
jgi:transcriptional regulator with XRE-family HTH domain